MELRKLWSQNWFVCLLWLSLLLAYLLPQLGGWIVARLPAGLLLTVLIFFCIGLTLPSETLWHNLSNWKFHLSVQVYIFVFHPLFFFLVLAPWRRFFIPELLLGFAALAVLPTSVSSCVLFCKESGGNETLAVVNSVLANILGIFLTPLLLGLSASLLFPELLHNSEPAQLSLISVFGALSWKIFLPMSLGHLLRRLALPWVKSHRKQFSILNNLAIVLIVFFSFSKAVRQDSFVFALKSLPLSFAFLPFAFLLLAQPVLLLLAKLYGRLLGLGRAERIALAFTSSQKTIAMGVPLLNSFFGDQVGLILLPLLFYHPWQLIVASFARLHYLRQAS